MPPTIRPSGRFSVERRRDDLWIFIGPRRAWIVVAIMSLWLCGWALGEVAVLATLVGADTWAATEPAKGNPGVSLSWLAFWTLGGGVAISMVLVELALWQEIYVSRYLLVRRKRLFFWTRETVVDLSTVEEFRMSTAWQYPKDWMKGIDLPHQRFRRGLVVEYGGGRTLKLVVEGLEETLADKVRRALEEFQIPVRPSGELPSVDIFRPRPLPEGDGYLSLDPIDREEFWGVGSDVPGPTGPVPLNKVVLRWNAQIVLVILAFGGWFFWTRLGGVSSVYFALMAGYLLLFSVTGFLVVRRGWRRRKAGKPWDPPLERSWKDEFKSLAMVMIACFAIGGLGWFLCLQMPSRNLGRLDVVRRHVYSFGPELQSLEDGAGNRYTIRNLIEMSPRLHKYGPDGRLRWAISLETYRGVDPVLSIDPDGSLVIRMGSHVERYDSDGWEIVAPESSEASPEREPKSGS